MNYQNELNEKQYEAVTTSSPYVRIVAGAGSGKTRVLTYRIAYLISDMDVLPWSILAITFTNKVANEMKNRVVKMIPNCEKDLTIKTFHSFCAYFLRKEIDILGFPHSFTILDEEDQTKLMKDIAQEMGFKKGDKIVGRALWYVSANKLKNKYPEDIQIVNPTFEDERTCLEMYTRYEEEKNKAYCLDFDDLLLKTIFILENYVDIRNKWQSRYSHILIDEFQDTNDIEYRLVCLLKKPSTGLYIVGDPDQTIYTWRGANQNIILDIDKKFQMETIILDRNYRSTQNILNSANKLISHNKLRVKKDLYTKSANGEAILVHAAISSRNEAEFVAREIQKLVETRQYSYRDIVVLYRSSYVTIDFEKALTLKRIPYRIYGGLKFYERREIKDVLAYFRLLINPKDNISFERIINVPRRGIGDTTINALKDEAYKADMSLYEYVNSFDVEETVIARKAFNNLKSMVVVLECTKKKITNSEEIISKPLEDLITDLGYMDYLRQDDEADERIENVRSLFSDIRNFLKTNPESSLDEYLQNISLISAQDEVSEGQYVTLMTVHTAKGLEFPVVFLVRFNQGVFPHNRSISEGGYDALEEERRLAYVAYTRAKERLFITCAEDFSYVLQGQLKASQFIKESGLEVKKYNDTYTPRKVREYHFEDSEHIGFTIDKPLTQDFSTPTNGVTDWRVGDVLTHKTFGRGVVVAVDEDIIDVNFETHGMKTIMGNHPFVKKEGE